MAEAHVCEQLAYGRYLTAKRPGAELATSLDSQANALTIIRHQATLYFVTAA